jgi:hypothetical protein
MSGTPSPAGAHPDARATLDAQLWDIVLNQRRGNPGTVASTGHRHLTNMHYFANRTGSST